MQKIRNIAIIAHVDHGKTTLVDKMIMQGHLFRDNEKTGELIMDNNDLERERGITILSKNVSVNYNGYKINIIDTPGHSDFGGEVERVLNMADGVLLLVDAFEGTMPQTRFVLQKALSLGKKPIVVVNKVDKPNCRPEEVYEQVFDLMFTLNATEEQLDFVTIYGSAKQGWMSHVWKERTKDITPLLDAIIDNIPAPEMKEGTPQLLITSLEYSPYVGRIAVGKLTRGTLRSGMPITLAKRDGKTMVKTRIKDLMVFDRDRRADDEHAVHDQRLSLFRPRGQVCHFAPYQGAARPRVGEEPRAAGRARGVVRQFRRVRTRRAAPVGVDRDDAPRRVRASGRAAESHHQADRRAEVRAGRGADDRHSRGILGPCDRVGNQAQGHDDRHDDRARPSAHRVRHSVARHHRTAQQPADGYGRRGRHVAPAERLRAL